MDGEFADQFSGILSSFFNLPAEWMGFPQIVFYLFIPLAALIFMWYNFLHRKIKIFRNMGVNIGISFILGIVTVWLVKGFGPLWTTAITVGITIMAMGKFTLLRMVAAVAIPVIVYLILEIIFSVLMVGVNI